MGAGHRAALQAAKGARVRGAAAQDMSRWSRSAATEAKRRARVSRHERCTRTAGRQFLPGRCLKRAAAACGARRGAESAQAAHELMGTVNLTTYAP